MVISTHTISLQEQLLTKDIPLLRSVMPTEFTAVLVKGRRNYLSLRRMKNALGRAAGLFSEEEEYEQLRQIEAWSRETTDGSLSDLAYKPSPAVWEEVASDSTNCMGRKCPTYAACFYYQARRRMSHAQILVVNHALYFTDLALRMEGVGMLPKHDIVIFDEAHTLESVAGDHLGLRLTNGQVEFTLRRLYNDRTNKGLLVRPGYREAQEQVLDCYHRARAVFRRHRPMARPADGRQRPRAATADRRECPERRPEQAFAAGPPAGQVDPEGRGAAGFHRRRRPAGRHGRGLRSMEHAADGRGRLLGRGHADPSRATDLAGRHADRRRPHPPRAPLQQGAHGGHDQRHAGHGGQVRFLPVPRRAVANGRRSAWAALSTTRSRPN